MSPSRRGTSKLAARIATAALFLALAAAVSPFVPSVTATDPTADPGASPTAGPTADPAASPDPAPSPDPGASPDPAASPDPTASPDPPASPDPTASPDPGPTPSPEPAPAPSPSDPPATSTPSSPPVEPPISPLETPGPDPTPSVIGPLTLGPLTLGPTGLVEGASPFSPHLVDSLTADGCGYCHRASTANQGSLTVAPYRDEALKPAGEAFQATDFGLCFLCHSTTPFTTSGTGETAFDLHALHLADVDDPGGGGLDIDVAGDGQGNAICAECHFQLHQTAPQVDQQLVGFAPNVVPNGGVLEWTDTVGRSCTLTCHGHAHAAAGY